MDLISTMTDATETGHVFVFSFAGAGAEVTTSVRIDVADPLMAEAFAANLLAEIAQRMEGKRMSYEALQALSVLPPEPVAATVATPAKVAIA
ncbi:hypothetical protein [Brevundimonas sp.]|jgi:hypothetical protein|uniref:hypothetical protein n=1 Tax=Brevundimonas sp. TaxID=1871086 RepID=UPI0037C0B0E4